MDYEPVDDATKDQKVPKQKVSYSLQYTLYQAWLTNATLY